MTPFRRLAVLAVGGLLVAAVAARSRDEDTAAKPPADVVAERSEDVEVLRRILNHSLGLPDKAVVFPPAPTSYMGSTTQPSPQWFNSQGRLTPGTQPYETLSTIYASNLLSRTTAPIGPFDGIYLTGHGVVFTLKVPEDAGMMLDPPARAVGLAETCAKCHTTISRGDLEANPHAAPPQSEWERVQAELRGEKPKAEQPKGPAGLTRQQICAPGALTERLVGKLWQNARHVRYLSADERVTVVVTFDGVAGSARDRQVLDPGSDWAKRFAGGVTPPAGAAPKGPAGKPGFMPEEVQQLTLGDLHLKQNKPKEAAAAYERALARYKEPVSRLPVSLKHMEGTLKTLAGEAQKEVRAAYAKLAQAHLATGNTDKAAAALELARKFKVELIDTPDGPKGVPVPTKLVISVARADLDKAGDLAAFKKAMKVELTGFPPPDAKK